MVVTLEVVEIASSAGDEGEDDGGGVGDGGGEGGDVGGGGESGGDGGVAGTWTDAKTIVVGKTEMLTV